VRSILRDGASSSRALLREPRLVRVGVLGVQHIATTLNVRPPSGAETHTRPREPKHVGAPLWIIDALRPRRALPSLGLVSGQSVAEKIDHRKF
jgi:hypothetical protein